MILYSSISRGQCVLAEHTFGFGNFADLCEKVRLKITPDDFMMTYTHDEYLISHISENDIVYICITDTDFDRHRAFLFLADIKEKFLEANGAQADVQQAAAFSSVLSVRQSHFNQPMDKITQVEGQVEDLHQIMVTAIESMVNRGERLERLVDRTADLEGSSVTFGSGTRRVARQMYWKNIRTMVIVCVVVLLIIGVIVAIVMLNKS